MRLDCAKASLTAQRNRDMIRRFILLTWISIAVPSLVHAEDPSLIQLRTELAKRYVEPKPHMALAKYYYDKGNRIQAFLILEYVRRGLFPEQQFNEAFDQAFVKRDPFDNGKAAEEELLRKLTRNPKSVETLVKLADIHISRSEWTKAKEYLTQAIKLKPEEFVNVEALAEVMRQEGKSKDAERLIQAHLDQHPDFKESYSRKIGPLIKKEPEKAKALLAEAMTKFPREGEFVFNLAVIHQNENKLNEAEEEFIRAARLAKESPHIQGWVGRFFLKVKMKESLALEFYLNAYFLDPHFYDSEYAEERIGILSTNAAEKRYKELLKNGKDLPALIKDDHPIVVGMAVDEIGKNWNRSCLKSVMEALGHDDEYVRAKALRILVKNVDRTFDPELKELLQEKDLRKRGMAGYLAVKLWGKEGIDVVKPWLKQDEQLLRYDAVSALVQYGGEAGRLAVLDYRPQEKHPWMKHWLENLDKK